MKHSCKWILATLAFAPQGGALTYGPQKCVSLTRSSEGSCVISTNCDGVDLSSFEFAFDCADDDGLVKRHSFGFGGFDAEEEFDTSVKCVSCTEPPAPPGKAGPKPVISPNAAAPVAAVGFAASEDKDEEKDKEKDKEKDEKKEKDKEDGEKKESEGDLKPPEDSSKIVKYGPGGCISTWQAESDTKHCVMMTECEGQDISKYMFGLLCEDKDGLTRHLFGQGSFDPKETFDTLIPCDKCLALEAPPDVELKTEVSSLKEEVSSLKKGVDELDDKVAVLNHEHKADEAKEEKEEKEEQDDDKKDDKEKDEKKDDKEQSLVHKTSRRQLRQRRVHPAKKMGQDKDDDSSDAGSHDEDTHHLHKRSLVHKKSKGTRSEDDSGSDVQSDNEDVDTHHHQKRSSAHKKTKEVQSNEDDSDDQSDDEDTHRHRKPSLVHKKTEDDDSDEESDDEDQ